MYIYTCICIYIYIYINKDRPKAHPISKIQHQHQHHPQKCEYTHDYNILKRRCQVARALRRRVDHVSGHGRERVNISQIFTTRISISPQVIPGNIKRPPSKIVPKHAPEISPKSINTLPGCPTQTFKSATFSDPGPTFKSKLSQGFSIDPKWC